MAVSNEELHPAETGMMAGTDTTEEARQRITATESGANPDFELSRLDPREANDGATIRHQFQDVLEGHAVPPTGRPKLSSLSYGIIPAYDRGFFSVPPIGLRYFGHWLTDGLAT
ncbi:hypothetical protein [Palleronia sp. LCG004]|uniref:hypothetical protein n=1 Tax=Palleronia sp. LCG004 TaxID=3079304 RepID=UPI002941C5F6|nr:hypothetical protein [Palleronia sp. LCG004]WOI56522.1 hypothetical protein RVY76_01615 [Palleronia sp. LCG004]